MSPRPQFPPARGYTRTFPPFEEGNQVALRHGARSPRVVEPLADECREYIERIIEAEDISYLKLPSFQIALDNLAWSWAQVLKLRQWVLEHPEDMKVRDQLERFEARFDKRLAACGFYPLDGARLRQVLTSAAANQIDIAAEIERGRQIRLQREATEKPSKPTETTDPDNAA
ncbi:MAG: hypothetical protein M3Q18_10375 [Actinomycetota bacterium]|nr:hypothetical protein [Actinomycetota bacterium]